MRSSMPFAALALLALVLAAGCAHNSVVPGPVTFAPLTAEKIAEFHEWYSKDSLGYAQIPGRGFGSLDILKRPCPVPHSAELVGTCDFEMHWNIGGPYNGLDYAQYLSGRDLATDGTYTAALPNLLVDGVRCRHVFTQRAPASSRRPGYESPDVVARLFARRRPLRLLGLTTVAKGRWGAYGIRRDGTLADFSSPWNLPWEDHIVQTGLVRLGPGSGGVVRVITDPQRSFVVAVRGTVWKNDARIFAATSDALLLPTSHDGFVDLAVGHRTGDDMLYWFNGRRYVIAPCQDVESFIGRL